MSRTPIDRPGREGGVRPPRAGLAGRPGRRLPTLLASLLVGAGPLLLAAGLLLAAPAGAAGQDIEELRQQAEQRLGRPLSDQEIIQRLRQSGLTPEQIRDRLEARGFPRTAADEYLRVLEGRASQVPSGTNPMPLITVLTGAEARLDTLRRLGRVPSPDTLPFLRREEERFLGPPVFGREIFRRATSQFQPVTSGPVPPDYRLGPGDQIVLVLTGGVEQAYELTVSREGWIVIPDVGRVFVNGKTLGELEESLFGRLAQVYSGIQRGPGATTFFDVSVGRLRTNQVYVIGEVERPSAYELSSLATALTALYYAGGPTRAGSFREIVVNRGGRAAARIDLYDYLLEGKAEEDVRLQQGDIVFVPVARKRVEVQGPVTRPAIYELTGEEDLRDLIRFAGGVQPNAELRRVQIRRILAAGERAPGRDRAVLDVPVGDLRAEDGPRIGLRDGDKVSVFALLEEARNEVQVSGGVWRPGTYGAGEETRLWDVIEAAGGLLPDAYEGRAQIQRLQPDYTRRLVPVSLARDSAGRPLENPRIEGMDQVFIYPRRELREERAVSIGGWVREPGVYPFVEGMTVADLVLKAGGLRTGAFTGRAEVARVTLSQARTDTLTRRFQVPLDSTLVFDARDPAGAEVAAGGRDGADGDGARPAAAYRFELENLDAVYVRKAPGFEPQERVIVTGEVLYPGPYSIQTRGERLGDLIRRAGGLTEEAYPEGAQLWRAEPRAREEERLTAAEIAARAVGDTGLRVMADTVPGRGARAQRRQGARPEGREPEGEEAARDTAARLFEPVERTLVGVDFPRALEEARSRHNVFIQPNDSVHVPQYIPTVDVRGAVGSETKVLWREGEGLGYYIRQAGGYAEHADEGRVRIRYANGDVVTKGGKFLFFGGGIPDPGPGSTVVVPAEPPSEREGMSVTELVGLITSVLTASASVVIAASR